MDNDFLDYLVILACFVLEYYHPEMVHHVGNGATQSLEVFISLIIIGSVLGMIFTLQSHLYEKQAKLLLEKEEHLKETMEALEKANNAKSEFLANMSHEIRTPINAVLGMNEMILRESKDDKTLEYAYNVDNATHTLLSLVNDILDFTKIDSGKMEIVSTDYEIYKLLKDCYNLVARKAKEKKIKFLVINNPSMPSVIKGDENRVRQVITNILTNAVKYTSSGSVTMNVDYEMTGDDTMNLIVSVADTGIGIKDEDKPSVFGKFERFEVQSNRNIEGSGLGLAITKNLVDLMNGSITFESQYGIGSTFTVSIPQIVTDATFVGNLFERYELGEERKEKYHKSFTAPEARILAVDDVKINNDVISGLLKQTEVQIDCVYSGRECLNCLRKKHYDLVLLDHMMPEMDGIETLRRIRNLDGLINNDIPVIILTANAIVGVKEEYLKLGFDDYLSKPVESKELERVIAKHLPSRLLQSTDAIEAAEDKSKIDKLDFLDTAYGMHCCADSEEIYMKAVEGYVSRDNKLDILKQAYEEKKWEEYILIVHSLKNLSLLIGARNLSDEARGLEFAAKDDRIDTVELNHNLFVTHYEKLIDSIKEELEVK